LWQADRLLNQLLVETDGLDSGFSRDGGKVVIVIGATSRPEGVPSAILWLW
jgi:ATP-dependent Zn protease